MSKNPSIASLIRGGRTLLNLAYFAAEAANNGLDLQLNWRPRAERKGWTLSVQGSRTDIGTLVLSHPHESLNDAVNESRDKFRAAINGDPEPGQALYPPTMFQEPIRPGD